MSRCKIYKMILIIFVLKVWAIDKTLIENEM